MVDHLREGGIPQPEDVAAMATTDRIDVDERVSG